jgi:hypothetical protein
VQKPRHSTPVAAGDREEVVAAVIAKRPFRYIEAYRKVVGKTVVDSVITFNRP